MKKLFCLIIAALLIFSFSACTNTPNDTSSSSAQKPDEPEKITEVDYPTDGYDFERTLGNAADYEVVVSENATASEIYAADTFVSYVKQVTGKTINYGDENDDLTKKKAVVIGDTKHWNELGFNYTEETLNGDGFVIKTSGDDLFVRGAIDRGTIYGVLDIIENMLGVKWLTEDYTYVPSDANAKLYYADKVSVPAFRYRAYLDKTVYTNKNKDYIVYRRYTSDYVSTSDDMGGNIKMYNGFKYNRTHNALEYIDLEEVSSQNAIKPEYMHAFSNDGGEVLKGNAGVLGLYANDLCYTDGINDDGTFYSTVTKDGVTTKTAIALAIDGLKKKILEDENASNYYLFGQNDLSSRPCACSDCKAASEKYTDAGIMIRFFNCLISAINEWKAEAGIDREINLVMFAYEYSAFAPVKETENGKFEPIDSTVKANDNLVIRIAPVKSEYTYAYSDSRQDSNEYGSKYLDKWKAIGEHFMVWSYHSNFKYYYVYLPTMQTWHQNLNDLKDMGVIYNFMQPNYEEKTTYQSRLESYVASKMLWNPDYDYNYLVDEFNRYYYGEVAFDYVREYNDMIVNAYLAAMENGGYTTKTLDFVDNLSVFTKGVLRRGVTLFDDAIAAVNASAELSSEDKQIYVSRLKEAQLTPRYSYLINATNLGYNSAEVNIMAQQFISDALSFGATNFGEGSNRKFDLNEIIYRN